MILGQQIPKYGLRKLSVGVASVMLGFTFVTTVGHADNLLVNKNDVNVVPQTIASEAPESEQVFNPKDDVNVSAGHKMSVDSDGVVNNDSFIAKEGTSVNNATVTSKQAKSNKSVATGVNSSENADVNAVENTGQENFSEAIGDNISNRQDVQPGVSNSTISTLNSNLRGNKHIDESMFAGNDNTVPFLSLASVQSDSNQQSHRSQSWIDANTRYTGDITFSFYSSSVLPKPFNSSSMKLHYNFIRSYNVNGNKEVFGDWHLDKNSMRLDYQGETGKLITKDLDQTLFSSDFFNNDHNTPYVMMDLSKVLPALPSGWHYSYSSMMYGSKMTFPSGIFSENGIEGHGHDSLTLEIEKDNTFKFVYRDRASNHAFCTLNISNFDQILNSYHGVNFPAQANNSTITFSNLFSLNGENTYRFRFVKPVGLKVFDGKSNDVTHDSNLQYVFVTNIGSQDPNYKDAISKYPNLGKLTSIDPNKISEDEYQADVLNYYIEATYSYDQMNNGTLEIITDPIVRQRTFPRKYTINYKYADDNALKPDNQNLVVDESKAGQDFAPSQMIQFNLLADQTYDAAKNRIEYSNWHSDVSNLPVTLGLEYNSNVDNHFTEKLSVGLFPLTGSNDTLNQKYSFATVRTITLKDKQSTTATSLDNYGSFVHSSSYSASTCNFVNVNDALANKSFVVMLNSTEYMPEELDGAIIDLYAYKRLFHVTGVAIDSKTGEALGKPFDFGRKSTDEMMTDGWNLDLTQLNPDKNKYVVDGSDTINLKVKKGNNIHWDIPQGSLNPIDGNNKNGFLYGNGNDQLPVKFKTVQSTITIDFIDDDGLAIPSAVISGTSGDPADLSKVTIPTGYQLVFTLPANQKFTVKPQTITLHVKHQHQDVTMTDPKAAVVREYKIVERRPAKYGGNKAIIDVKAVFHRDSDKDLATGKVTYGKFKSNNIEITVLAGTAITPGHFDYVKSLVDKIDGYDIDYSYSAGNSGNLKAGTTSMESKHSGQSYIWHTWKDSDGNVVFDIINGDTGNSDNVQVITSDIPESKTMYIDYVPQEHTVTIDFKVKAGRNWDGSFLIYSLLSSISPMVVKGKTDQAISVESFDNYLKQHGLNPKAFACQDFPDILTISSKDSTRQVGVLEYDASIHYNFIDFITGKRIYSSSVNPIISRFDNLQSLKNYNGFVTDGLDVKLQNKYIAYALPEDVIVDTPKLYIADILVGHKVVHVTPDNVNDYPNYVKPSDLSVTRKLIFECHYDKNEPYDSAGSTKYVDSGISHTFIRNADIDLVTGKVTYGQWSDDGKWLMPGVHLPTEKGYRLDSGYVKYTSECLDECKQDNFDNYLFADLDLYKSWQSKFAAFQMKGSGNDVFQFGDNSVYPDGNYEGDTFVELFYHIDKPQYTINFVTPDSQNVSSVNDYGSVKVSSVSPKGYHLLLPQADFITSATDSRDYTVVITKDVPTVYHVGDADVPANVNQPLMKSITRTVGIKLPNGKLLEVKQSVKFTRTATVNTDGEITYSDWQAVGDDKWDDIRIPERRGYKLEIVNNATTDANAVLDGDVLKGHAISSKNEIVVLTYVCL